MQRDRSHFFYERFFIFFIWNEFTNHFLLCGAIGKSELQKETSLNFSYQIWLYEFLVMSFGFRNDPATFFDE